jgi:hypothetical protein
VRRARDGRTYTSDTAALAHHVSTGTGLAPATSALALGSPLPDQHRDWAHPCQHLHRDCAESLPARKKVVKLSGVGPWHVRRWAIASSERCVGTIGSGGCPGSAATGSMLTESASHLQVRCRGINQPGCFSIHMKRRSAFSSGSIGVRAARAERKKNATNPKSRRATRPRRARRRDTWQVRARRRAATTARWSWADVANGAVGRGRRRGGRASGHGRRSCLRSERRGDRRGELGLQRARRIAPMQKKGDESERKRERRNKQTKTRTIGTRRTNQKPGRA